MRGKMRGMGRGGIFGWQTNADEAATAARSLIRIDNNTTRAVNEGFSSAPGFCAETAMPGNENWNSAKAQP
jgi:hypothetical protein